MHYFIIEKPHKIDKNIELVYSEGSTWIRDPLRAKQFLTFHSALDYAITEIKIWNDIFRVDIDSLNKYTVKRELFTKAEIVSQLYKKVSDTDKDFIYIRLTKEWSKDCLDMLYTRESIIFNGKEQGLAIRKNKDLSFSLLKENKGFLYRIAQFNSRADINNLTDLLLDKRIYT